MNATAITVDRIKARLQHGHLRQAGTSCLFGAVVLLLSGMMLLGANVSKLRDSYNWIQRSNAVLLQIAEVDAKLVGVEMTVRGYALTDDPAFLRYQKYEREHVTAAMDKLAALIGADASHAASFGLLKSLVAKRLALYTYLSGLGPGHAQEVAAAIRDPAKRDDMLNARVLLVHFRDQEMRLLAERQNAAAEQAAGSYELAFVIVVLAFVLSAMGFAFMLYGRGRAD
jgi:two-component system, LuxR family, sensor kinase FixL